MDTLVTITVVSDSGDVAEKAIDKAFEKIKRLDGLINFFSEKSELSSINSNAGVSPVKVSPETLDLIEKAVYASEKTEGAFDATIGPVITQWNFSDAAAQKVPDVELIKEKRRLVNYRKITIDRDRETVYLTEKGMLLDLGGIAKGYAADAAVEELKKQGIISGLVAASGDIRAFGLKPGDKGWMIGIRNPRAKGKDDEIMATIELKNMAISTSGDYERFFIKDGKRYHHLIDPKTGYPSDRCRSVSVMTADGVYTDSFATAVFILGKDRGMQVLQKMGFEGIIVDNEGKVHMTEGLRGRVEFKGNN